MLHALWGGGVPSYSINFTRLCKLPILIHRHSNEDIRGLWCY